MEALATAQPDGLAFNENRAIRWSVHCWLNPGEL
jgi:hypothetical protein